MANWPTGPSLKNLNLFGCSGESEGTQLSASDSICGGGAECSRLHRLYVCLCMQKMKVKQHKTLGPGLVKRRHALGLAFFFQNTEQHFALVGRVFSFSSHFSEMMKTIPKYKYVYIHIRRSIIIIIIKAHTTARSRTSSHVKCTPNQHVAV